MNENCVLTLCAATVTAAQAFGGPATGPDLDTFSRTLRKVSRNLYKWDSTGTELTKAEIAADTLTSERVGQLIHLAFDVKVAQGPMIGYVSIGFRA